MKKKKKARYQNLARAIWVLLSCRRYGGGRRSGPGAAASVASSCTATRRSKRSSRGPHRPRSSAARSSRTPPPPQFRPPSAKSSGPRFGCTRSRPRSPRSARAGPELSAEAAAAGSRTRSTRRKSPTNTTPSLMNPQKEWPLFQGKQKNSGPLFIYFFYFFLFFKDENIQVLNLILFCSTFLSFFLVHVVLFYWLNKNINVIHLFNHILDTIFSFFFSFFLYIKLSLN